MSGLRVLRVGVVCLLLLPVTASASSGRYLSLADRLDAQRAIERVYYSHVDGALRTFEQAVTHDLLDRKVRSYLRQSAALEEYWGTAVTGEMLRAEAARIGRGTRFPDRLAEIRTALGQDDFIVAETFVRATLVDRLARGFLATDERVQGAARAEADRIHQSLVAGTLDPSLEHPRRTLIVEPGWGPSAVAGSTRAPLIQAVLEATERSSEPAGGAGSGVGEVSEDARAYTIEVGLPPRNGAVRVARYEVPKVTWDTWWADHAADFDETHVSSVAGANSFLPWDAGVSGGRFCPPDDTWDNGALNSFPDPRYDHTTIWTGTEMIVWGGRTTQTSAPNGGRYDPLTDTWRILSSVGAPPVSYQGTAVWTGSEMIVWGGVANSVRTAGRYDPVTDSWAPVSDVGEPSPRYRHTAIWTGTEMIVWGGGEYVAFSDGARYEPATDTWRALPTVGAPAARGGHTAVWTGTEMIVWGGSRSDPYSSKTYFATGARYDPATDRWLPVAALNAPIARDQHSAIWTGQEMVVWGGTVTFSGVQLVSNTGARYDPAADLWIPTSLTGTPFARRGHSAVWTGTRMIVWGGSTSVTSLSLSQQYPAATYDPHSDTWGMTTQVNAPSSSVSHSAVWTGSRMIVWGGIRGNGAGGSVLPRGGRYDPAADSWTPTAERPSNLSVYGGESTVWTGTEMIAWSSDGARYDPAADAWRAISTTGAPARRISHVAVWTGEEMLIWGGSDAGVYFAEGGRYDPLMDSWRPTALLNAPEVRLEATAVWTGKEMIVWGGYHGTKILGTGGRYDPDADAWRSVADANAPAPVYDHSAVWTGQEMIILGGYRGNALGATGNGARYDPRLDLWIPLPALPSGQQRNGHRAIWTGREMFVVGGGDPSLSKPGWIYDRSTDSWRPLDFPYPGFPLARQGHAVVWTGRHLLVWGPTFQGVTYDTVDGTWGFISETGEPLRRSDTSAVWTGREMLVWGGINGAARLPTGGRYLFGQSTDDDGDGLSECAGDCDDTDAGVWPGAPERCNGRDDSCDGVVDEDSSGIDTDGDGTPNACDACPTFVNPGQSERYACFAAVEDGGQCLETQLLLTEPIEDGVITLIHETPGPPDIIHFDLSLTSCGWVAPVEVLLNDHVVVTFVEPAATCACLPPLYRVSITEDTLRGLWHPNGTNTFRIRKAGLAGSWEGTFLSWVRARIGSGITRPSETVCLFDFGGSKCTELNQCRVPTTPENVDVEFPVTTQIQIEDPLLSVPFSASAPPSIIDIADVQDGQAKLCIGPSTPPRLYAANISGGVYMVDLGTGASTLVGALPAGVIELAHDPLFRWTHAQISTPGGPAIARLVMPGWTLSGTVPFLGRAMSGLDSVNGLLYGVESVASAARMMEIDPQTGHDRVFSRLPDGSWEGLTYDPDAVVFYAARTLGSVTTLWSVDAFYGALRELHPLSFRPGALEIGPDGALYAARPDGSDTSLYRLDPVTGTETLVGHMGVAEVMSMVSVRNLPRGCFDLLKQGERSLATGGVCNSAPRASAGADLSAECTSPMGALVRLDGSSSTDPDSTPGTQDDIVSLEWFENLHTPSQALLGSGEVLDIMLPLGEHAITLRVTDRAGEAATDEIWARIVDTTAPSLSAAVSPLRLWPPSHHMVDVTAVVSAADACGPASVTLLSVSSSEADDAPGQGDGSTSGDIEGADTGTADLAFRLRAERDGSRGGRVYTIVYRAADSLGNSTQRAVDIAVPHDQGGVTQPVELQVHEGPTGTLVEWADVPGALFYNVVRGRVSQLRMTASSIDLGAVQCIEAGSRDSSTLGMEDALVPEEGEAFFYLVEYADGWISSFGQESLPKPRVVGSGGCS